jgi:hypothetical protein
MEDASLMNLMNMVRLCGLVAIGWTLMALGIGVLGIKGSPPAATNFFLPEPSLHETLAVSRSGLAGLEEYRLVDRSTGSALPLALPEDEKWACLSVAPWRDQEGNLEAAGRWIRRNPTAEQAFCGLGLLRLGDTKVVDRIDLDVLPTGRPCWVPGRPGDLLFPAGDGLLYRCRLTRGQDARTENGIGQRGTAHSGKSTLPRPVTWRCAVPGSGGTFVSDPVWSSAKELRRFVFVSLSLQSRVDARRVYEHARIWWLEMNEHADEIVGAGRLTVPEPRSTGSRSMDERMPNVSVCPSGKLTVAYLTRAHENNSWRLNLAPLALDVRTGRPAIAGGPGEVASDLQLIPPAFSTDGQIVFASAKDGRIKKYPVPW